jgi:hypothetical protein
VARPTRKADTRVQDAYSLRCAPQVLGAGPRHLDHARAVVESELASAIDNPVVLADGRVASCGNFHGAPLGYVADFLAIAARRPARRSPSGGSTAMLDPARSHGLPPFLAADPGVDSGLMLAQYSAAALTADCRGWRPRRASTTSRRRPCRRTTCPWAGRPAASCVRVVDNFHQSGGNRSHDLGPGRRAPRPHAACAGNPRRCWTVYANRCPGVGPDRYMAPELDLMDGMVTSGKIVLGPSRPPAPFDRGRNRGFFGPPVRAKGDDMPASETRRLKAARGSELHCRSWPQEAAWRMLHNNLDPEVAERPDDLVVYGGGGKAARDWPSFDAISKTLQRLDDDETLLVQSGRPVGVLRTHEWAPRVLIANANLVGEWDNWDEFRRLDQLGLTMYGQMTAGSWIYIGTQGILQGTYETFAAIAAKRFGGSLAGTLTLTAGRAAWAAPSLWP